MVFQLRQTALPFLEETLPLVLSRMVLPVYHKVPMERGMQWLPFLTTLFYITLQGVIPSQYAIFRENVPDKILETKFDDSKS